MKIYILAIDWAYDFAQDMDVKPFLFEYEAQRAMKEGFEDFVAHNYDKDGKFNMKVLDSNSASVYQEGCWAENHCAWTIYERDINDGAEPVAWLSKEDFEINGFEPECGNVSLKTIASRMGDYYCDGDFGEDLIYACEHYDWPRLEEEEEDISAD